MEVFQLDDVDVKQPAAFHATSLRASFQINRANAANSDTEEELVINENGTAAQDKELTRLAPAGALPNSNAPPEIPLLESISASSSAPAPAPSSPKKPVDAFRAIRSVSKGEKEVHFVSDREWEEGWQNKLAARTKKLSFGHAFVLTDDVSYDAHNANELTDDATVRLARMCPSLRVVKLQGVDASRLTDTTLIAFLSNCVDLTSIEITGYKAAGTIKEASFDALREHPSWAPKLRTLRIPECGYAAHKDKNKWMKAMRALSRERETLLIEVVSMSQVKKWGDWELETLLLDKYRKGKVQRPW
ncbi:hypothetical protein PT974_10774 [Cladobotryum mycophilum]|uniref:Uncharacterized protein n=1 Tax=Cladobotryum mycophilum TaxID=491253 RepID=A0ABR0SBS3_9HYPO